MTTSITRIVDKHGDFVLHVGGCADIKRAHSSRSQGDAPETYSAPTWVQAIRAADEDMAAWFGQEAYQANPPEQPWTVAGIAHAPCLRPVLRAAGIRFNPQTDEPSGEAFTGTVVGRYG